MEKWKSVVGYEGFFDVSSLGGVRSISRVSNRGRPVGGKTLKPHKTPKGYMRVALWVDGCPKKFFVHRLVLEAFVGPCPDGMEGCHNDGDRGNNKLENLRWDTASSNWDDRRVHGTASVGEKHPMARLSEGEVILIKEALSAGERGKLLATRFGVSEYVISSIKTGKSWANTHV